MTREYSSLLYRRSGNSAVMFCFFFLIIIVRFYRDSFRKSWPDYQQSNNCVINMPDLGGRTAAEDSFETILQVCV